MTVHYTSLVINLNRRNKDSSPTVHKYLENRVHFLVFREPTSLTVSFIENGLEKDRLTTTFYVVPIQNLKNVR